MRDHMFYALAQAIVALNNAKPSLPTADEIEAAIFDFVMHWDYIKGELRPAHRGPDGVGGLQCSESTHLGDFIGDESTWPPGAFLHEHIDFPRARLLDALDAKMGDQAVRHGGHQPRDGAARGGHGNPLAVRDESWAEMTPADMPIGTTLWIAASEAVPVGWQIVRVETGMHMIERRA